MYGLSFVCKCQRNVLQTKKCMSACRSLRFNAVIGTFCTAECARCLALIWHQTSSLSDSAENRCSSIFTWTKPTSNRRKFRSETSDNMDSWKAEVRRVRREKIRRKKMQMREKVGKSRFTVFFQWFVAPEGRKVGSLKRRVRSQLARWEMKNCTPLWREAHFQVKMYKTHQVRTTFWSCDVEKVHAVVARSTFPSQKC